MDPKIRSIGVAGALSLATLLTPVLSGSAAAASGGVKGAGAREQAYRHYYKTHTPAPTNTHTGDDGGLADIQAAYANERTAPAFSVSGDALVAANAAAAKLPKTGAAWTEVTTKPYNAESPDYSDPFWSNVGAGFGIVGGRTTALATTPDGTLFAGTADGGVWKSTDQGTTWIPTFDNQPTLSIGALAVQPGHGPGAGTLWVGTGEANTSQDSYKGTGIYTSTDGGSSYQRVGNNADGTNPIAGRTVFDIEFAPDGTVYAATNDGLWKLAPGSTTWTEPTVSPAYTANRPYYYNQVTSVKVVPGTNGQDVIAARAWRSANASTNGFYLSTDGGKTFNQVTPTGDIDANDIGRTTFAYSADGSKLYAIVQSPSKLLAGAGSVIQGIFAASGSPASVAGPWRKIADNTKLEQSGSALSGSYDVGVQGWYNQALAVDPKDPNTVFASLEEVFKTTNGGDSWSTASAYWNYPFACDANNTCPQTTHPDQHALLLTGGKVFIGNDGGVYSRPESKDGPGDWTDLNNTLRSWQYYDARAAKLPKSGVGYIGGLQDNGTSELQTGMSQMVEPASGDGFYVLIDPSNANTWAGEYTNGAMYSTTDGGHTFNNYVSPTCAAQDVTGIAERPDCDPAARFVTPITQDQQNKNTWLLGGEDVWVSQAGPRTVCDDNTCSWQNVFDTGAGNAVTALSSAGGGQTIWAAYVGGGGNPGKTFGRGIATNAGGTWHTVNMTGLPNRYIAGIAVDPADGNHAYAVFNGYSRRWIPSDPSSGTGHVFETTDAGQTWTDISGNLPDIGGDALVISHGKLALATDSGVYTAATGQGTGTQWSVLGTGLPHASINDLTVGPGDTLIAASHGRGIWQLAF